MADNVEVLLHTIPNLFDLCQTIRQAANHAAQTPASLPEMRENVRAGIAAVQASAGLLSPEQPPAAVALDDTAAMDGSQLAQFVQQWYTQTMGPHLVQGFQRHLQEEVQISQAQAQEISQWIIHQMPLQAEDKRRLLLELGMRCSAWAPEFSWDLMRKVLDGMSAEEQNRRFPHLKGKSYCPGRHPQTQLEQCPICGGAGEPYHAGLSVGAASYDPLFLPVKLWMRCEGCGNLYSRQFPTEFLQLGAEPTVVHPTPNRMVTRQVQATSLHIWGEILNKIRAYTAGTTLLEVGVGKGHLIAVAQEMGYDVMAVELLEDRAQTAADLLGLPIICGDFLRLEEQRQVDIISMGDVLEHLQHPVEGLKKAHGLLKDGGILWLSTPNFESSFSAMRKVFDPMWCEPYHITYFSRRGLMPILEQVGFELLEYTVSNRYNGSMELLLRKKTASEG